MATGNSRLRALSGIAACCIALVGCGRETAAPSDAPLSAEAMAFATAQQAWREQRRADLLRPDGWTSLIGLHWIEPGAHYVGSASDNGIRLAMGPAQMGMLKLGDDGVRLDPAQGAELTLDGAPLARPATLHPGDDASLTTVLGFDQGRGTAIVIRRGARHALRVRHADAPTRTGFSGLDYWAAQPEWVIDGRFVAHPPGRTIEIANIIGGTDDAPNPGIVEFDHAGTPYRLEALDGGDGTLFLVFADRTNGHGSYGAGRFLDVARPGADGKVVLDFNRAYNPPCAFTSFATCPLPPPDNRLNLAITAGEKAYRHATP